jgi:hypothetical protein
MATAIFFGCYLIANAIGQNENLAIATLAMPMFIFYDIYTTRKK